MPIRQDANGRWHAEVCVRRIRLHRKLPAGATSRDAKRVDAELTRAAAAAAPARVVEIPGDPLLAELLGDYVTRHSLTLRSGDTARHHALRIGRWVEGRRASETRQVVAAIVRDLTPHYAPGTINRSLGTLSKALRDAWQRGRLTTDYSSLVRRLPERNERDTYLTIDEVRRLADHASQSTRAAIWIALLTGCRRGEILAIRPEDIRPDSITIRAGNTKTQRTRTVPVVPALRPWLGHIPIDLTAEGLKSGFRRAREAAGMPHVHFHDLRHSCATLLLQLGAPLHVVRDVLGHSSIKVTERYAHTIAGPAREALARLGDYTRVLHPVAGSGG